jgi:transposase-like protein
MYEAPDRQSCTQQRVAYCAQLRAQGQADAADCLERDWDDFITFYDFPQEHWTHLRTSNPIESVFAGVRLRTDAAKRMRVRDNVLYLVFTRVPQQGRPTKEETAHEMRRYGTARRGGVVPRCSSHRPC